MSINTQPKKKQKMSDEILTRPSNELTRDRFFFEDFNDLADHMASIQKDYAKYIDNSATSEYGGYDTFGKSISSS